MEPTACKVRLLLRSYAECRFAVSFTEGTFEQDSEWIQTHKKLYCQVKGFISGQMTKFSLLLL